MNTGLTTTPLCLDANWTNRILYAGMSGRAWNSEPTAKGGVFRTFLPGTPSMPTVSGFVKTAVGEGIPGVLLTFSAGGGTVTTGASGYYIQPVPAGWSGTVTPSKTGLIFAPADLTYTSVTSNQAGADYVGGVHAVSNPYIPSGLSRGEQGISYTFASGGSVCGLGHGVEYQFDWGDGTSSGWSAATSAAHAWPASGSYTLKAQARCSVDTGLVSGWSEGISVTILSQYTEADKYAVGDVDGDGRDEAAVDFGTLGVWLWNEGKWVKMTPTDPEHLVAGNLYGHDNDEIVGDFGADGIWRWNGSPWTLLSGQNPESMIVANTDGDAAEELFVDLGHFGTWLYDGPWWSQLIGVFAEYMAAADTDGDGADELAADLGYRGLWIWDGGTWTQWTEDDPEHFSAPTPTAIRPASWSSTLVPWVCGSGTAAPGPICRTTTPNSWRPGTPTGMGRMRWRSISGDSGFSSGTPAPGTI